MISENVPPELNYNMAVVGSVAELEPIAGATGAATLRAAPEPNFLLVGARSRGPHFLRRLWLHLLGKQKRKAFFLCQTCNLEG